MALLAFLCCRIVGMLWHDTLFTRALCKRPQGFQMLLDQQSGFGAVAEDLLHAVGDDFGRVPTILFSLAPAAAPPKPSGQVPGTTGRDRAATAAGSGAFLSGPARLPSKGYGVHSTFGQSMNGS